MFLKFIILILILLYFFAQGADEGLELSEEANETDLDLNVSWKTHNVHWVEVYSYGRQRMYNLVEKDYPVLFCIIIFTCYKKGKEVNVGQLTFVIGQAGLR